MYYVLLSWVEFCWITLSCVELHWIVFNYRLRAGKGFLMSSIVSKKLKVKFKSLSPVLFCKAVHDEKEGETPQEHEERTWKQRAHYNDKGKVIISGYMLSSTLEPAAKLLGERVGGSKVGKGMSHYIRLIQIEGDIVTNITQDTLEGNAAFVSANGQVGGGKVMRTYPKILRWSGTLTVVYPTLGNVLNDEVVMKYLEIAGLYIGIGHWRPGAPSRGTYGRFSVEKVG